VDIDNDRLRRAQDAGTDHTVNSAEDDLQGRVAELTDGKGASMVIEATGAEKALEQCFTVTAYRARVAVLGFYKSPLVQIPPIHIVKKELDVYGSRVYNNRFPLALDILGKRQVALEDLISHEFPFHQLEHAIRTALDPGEESLKVIISRS
jgi:L-iditol 2-dehydrogenase